MKRLLATVILLLLFCSACVAAVPAQPAPEAVQATQVPPATPEPTPEPTPVPLGVAPEDIFTSGYNPFFDVAFPSGYSVYAARFDTAQPEKGLGDQFALSLTAQGDPSDIARYFAGLLGITDETQLSGFAEAIKKDGFLQIDGKYLGQKAYVQLKQTTQGFEAEQNTDVDGCRAEIAVEVEQSQLDRYITLILANNNRTPLGSFADRLPDESIARDLLGIYVNKQQPDKTEIYLMFHCDDAKTLASEMAAKLPTKWVDEKSGSFGLSYGPIGYKFSFDFEKNLVYESIVPNDNTAAVKDFALSDVSLTKLGFQDFSMDGLAIYEDKKQGIQVAVAHPEWHHNEDWNFLALIEMNKNLISLQYFEASGVLNISVSRGNENAGTNYDLQSNTFDEGYPEPEQMRELFSATLGSAEGDLRERALALFTDLLNERFHMTWQEIYALPVW